MAEYCDSDLRGCSKLGRCKLEADKAEIASTVRSLNLIHPSSVRENKLWGAREIQNVVRRARQVGCPNA